MSGIPRAEVIGGLIRPDYLKHAREQWEGKKADFLRRAEAAGEGKGISTAAYKRLEDRAVDEAIALQERCGVDIVNDGEQRRVNFLEHWMSGIEGLSPLPSVPFTMRGSEGEKEIRFPFSVTSKIRRRLPRAAEEFVYARARATKPVKMTLPSPMLLASFYSPQHSSAAYRDPFDLFADGADIIHQECCDLAELGCEYIQIDSPELTMACDPRNRDGYLAVRNIDADRFVSEGVRLLNRIADVPDVRFGLHICRGGGGARSHFSEGGYDRISKEVFANARNYDAFLLEYDDARSGSFEPLRDVPTDKAVVLGLVSNNEERREETIDNLMERIDSAARYFPKDNMAISSRCGFGGCPSVELQSAKLKLVASVAHAVWR